ncbi:DUF692 domain-containing protein [Rickettsiales bacterium]|nr:DUF692 domain-containing protein [Rickettsiales bacterium]
MIDEAIFCKNNISGVGLGLRHQHFKNFIEDKPNVPWLEIHTENYFALGSPPSKHLEKIRRDYPISAHSIGMSLGSASTNCSIRKEHLKKIKATIDYFEPSLVSDHLSWSTSEEKIYLPDLLPIPYTQEAFDIFAENINYVQNFLNRQILIENPSAYISYKNSNINEWEFLSSLAKKTGCGILLDINNIFVSSYNHDFDAENYLEQIPVNIVKEMHLAGFEAKKVEGQDVLIDTHSRPVYEPVWDLYKKAAKKFANTPTLIEWDNDIPDLDILLEEKNKAEKIINIINKNKAA